MSLIIKILILVISISEIIPVNAQEIFKTKTAEIGFFSSAPVEDIRATSREGISVFKLSTGEISFLVPIRSLKFPKALMEDHFNEEFLESDRYPTASFKGKITSPAQLPSGGEVNVLLSGILEIHGVKRKRNIPAALNLDNDRVQLTSSFDVACKDHKIKIPKILWKNIAEIVRVDVNANYRLGI